MEKDNDINKSYEIKTFPVPLAFNKNKKNTVTTNHSSKSSNEEVIKQALKFHSQGNFKEAAKYYKHCIKQGINDHRIFVNYGLILKDLGMLKEAELFTRKSIQFKPDYAEAHAHLGMILKGLGKSNEGELSMRKAIELKPDFADFYSNLGNILHDIGDLKEAEKSYRKAIQINPKFPVAHYNLGKLLNDIGNLKEAEISYRNAIDIKPNFTEAIYNLSFVQMFQDNYVSGLKNYEARLKIKESKLHAQPQIPRWYGEPPEQEKKLLIISEQGLGDTIHFMRYIPYLRKKGYEVIFCAQESLHSIIKQSGIDSNPITNKQANNFMDGKYCPLLSLPLHLGVNQNNPIVSEPYISTKNELTAKWKAIFEEEERPIIGISWQGNPSIECGNVKGRSIALEMFSKLVKTDKYRFLSLQKGFGTEQIEQCSFKNKFVKFQGLVSNTCDFLDTAAHIQNCDLIITTDSCLAHLAAGMGKTTWVLLKAWLTWRYGLGETTFWYPSMKLFHQKERDNWDEVMDRIVMDLEHFIV